MSIFKKEEVKPIDMSVDAGRKKFIEEALNTNTRAEHVPMDVKPLEPPMAIPEVGVKEWKEDTKLSTDFKITIVIRASDRKLMLEMIDGMADILDKHGPRALEDFKIEKY